MGKKITRREFVKKTVAGSLALAARGPLGALASSAASPPNILVIMVDEMRLPYGPTGWIPAPMQQKWMPNLNRLLSRSACFENHFTAAVACSPARASLVTGLYAQQHNLLTTITSNTAPYLQTAFPTWGRALQGMNYDPYWIGKWHLSNPLNTDLSSYGFNGTIIDDPDGLPGQGQRRDPIIATEFLSWLNQRQSSSSANPFCTTVSFINPHDIAWFYRESDCMTQEAGPFPDFGPGFLDASYFTYGKSGVDSCPNFENPFNTSTPKPDLQKVFSIVMDEMGGAISFDPLTAGQVPSLQCAKNGSGPDQPFSEWYKMLRLYFYLHSMVDAEIGRVLNALQASPYGQNTVVIFTADHGEYGGAHGLRMKGAAAYEEAIKIPLAVFDPTGRFVADTGTARTGLTSSVDIMPLILTLASPTPSMPSWPVNYPYLANRFNLLPMLQSGAAPGRDHILYSTDEQFATAAPGGTPPFHVLTYRTAAGKLSTYSNWVGQTATIDPSSTQLEVYDYSTSQGRLEIPNVAGSSALTSLYMTKLFGPQGLGGSGGFNASEMQAPLPGALGQASETALAEYYQYLAGTQSSGSNDQ